MTKEVIENMGARQRAADKITTGETASGHRVFTGADSADTQTTVGAAGGAASLPATPLGYILTTIGGVLVKIPYYNP
jgi:hypothetical protein